MTRTIDQLTADEARAAVKLLLANLKISQRMVSHWDGRGKKYWDHLRIISEGTEDSLRVLLENDEPPSAGAEMLLGQANVLSDMWGKLMPLLDKLYKA